MTPEFHLESYLTNGVENIVKGIIKASLTNPKESIFMAKYAVASKTSSKLRRQAEENGVHIPPFLITSITSKCNLYCEGCYSRHNHACSDTENMGQLTDEEWLKIFKEAREMGVGFILLAGGEPLMRKDIIKAAGEIPEILFPVFTNGTMIDEDYLLIFDKYRNLVPVLSIEGDKGKTDERRGDGVYQKLMTAMERLKQHKLLFASSITVTKENLYEVTSGEFISKLAERGCKGIFYIEYVPVTKETRKLALDDADRDYLNNELIKLRQDYWNMLFISFPGDEKSSGGCLAAGRGFFHINSQGGAEPCPFSPYSDINVKDTSLKEALKSELFLKLKHQNILSQDHIGGCILFEQKDVVEKLLYQSE